MIVQVQETKHDPITAIIVSGFSTKSSAPQVSYRWYDIAQATPGHKSEMFTQLLPKQVSIMYRMSTNSAERNQVEIWPEIVNNR